MQSVWLCRLVRFSQIVHEINNETITRRQLEHVFCRRLSGFGTVYTNTCLGLLCTMSSIATIPLLLGDLELFWQHVWQFQGLLGFWSSTVSRLFHTQTDMSKTCFICETMKHANSLLSSLSLHTKTRHCFKELIETKLVQMFHPKITDG